MPPATAFSRRLVVALIVARILEPRSKLATVRGWDPQTLSSSLGELLQVESASADDLYGALDWLGARQQKIENRLASERLQDGCLVLYDVTSTGLLRRGTCPRAKRGYSRDRKRGKLQIIFGLLCDRQGCPVAVEVFEGNRADPTTVASQIQKLHSRFGLRSVVVVADRGMLTEARIREDLKPLPGMGWITALRSPRSANSLKPVRCSCPSLTTVTWPRFRAPITPRSGSSSASILCWRTNGLQTRQAVGGDRGRLEKIVQATRRPQGPFKGKDRWALRVGKVLNRYQVGKHFHWRSGRSPSPSTSAGAGAYRSGGCTGRDLCDSHQRAPELDAQQTVAAYKGLSVAERAFRSCKSVDLKVRPIYHHLEDRVELTSFSACSPTKWHLDRS